MLLATSVWFGAAHTQLPLALQARRSVEALVWGYKYLATGGNVVVPIVAHAVVNLCDALGLIRRCFR
jgi:membrane protease YdiL (CAAX protease family)